MWRELYWNEDNEAHIAKHHVTPDEVEEVVNARPHYVTKGRDESTVVYGQDAAGRTLLVVLVEAFDGRWYVVTARDMTDAEARLFRQKGR
ncbi:BrnT family toxin [Phytoactinopolyspora endophytica]|uniref:BrnT family toxin n=1 Tax=Phytoactinopolyspora endophytica TaxID=1642495 RepID=UPI00101D2E1D|nr:BrnT family toxin [Phytoactinopolyspora endophytica]